MQGNKKGVLQTTGLINFNKILFYEAFIIIIIIIIIIFNEQICSHMIFLIFYSW